MYPSSREKSPFRGGIDYEQNTTSRGPSFKRGVVAPSLGDRTSIGRSNPREHVAPSGMGE